MHCASYGAISLTSNISNDFRIADVISSTSEPYHGCLSRLTLKEVGGLEKKLAKHNKSFYSNKNFKRSQNIKRSARSFLARIMN